MREQRAFLRSLLSRLLAERSDSGGLYIPRGEAGMRRMIRHLLALRPPQARDPQLEEDIRTFLSFEEQSPADQSHPISRP